MKFIWNLLRTVISWALATALVCVCVAILFILFRADEELRLHIEKHLVYCYPNHDVSVGSAHLIKGQGIRLHNVSIIEPARFENIQRRETLFCEEVLLTCHTSMERLLRGQIDLDHVSIRGLTMRPRRDSDGRWHLKELLPKRKPHQQPPVISVKDAQLQLAIENQSAVAFNNIELQAVPVADGTFDAEIRFANELGTSNRLSAKILPTHWTLAGTIEKVDCGAELYQLLRAALQTLPPELERFQGNIGDLQLRLVQGKEERSPRFTVTGKLISGRYDPGELSTPITEITAGLFEVARTEEETGWRVEDLSARFGESRILGSARSPTLAIDGDLQLQGTVEKLQLTRQLIDLFPEKLQRTWAKYEPRGLIDVAIHSKRTDGTWWSAANAYCHDVTLLCTYFKYPLVKTRGHLQFRQHESLSLDLWAAIDLHTDVRPIQITADIERPGPSFAGVVEVRSHEHWVPLDNRISNALSPRMRNILLDMQPSGEINIQATLRKEDRRGSRLEKDIVIHVRDGTLVHRKFPYPLQNVGGRIHAREDGWTFEAFTGQNDSCTVTAAGQWTPATNPVEPAGLNLTFTATNIPCDAELRNALPLGPQKIWQSLRPIGHIDHATINLTQGSQGGQPQIDMLVKQLPRADDGSRGLEVQPTWLPLRMHGVTGVVNYKRDGSFQLEEIKATYGSKQRAVPIQSKGGGTFRKDGSWVLYLDRVLADGVELTPEVTSALPPDLGNAIRSLGVQGKISIDGAMQFAGGSAPDTPVDSNWASLINVDNGRFRLAGHNVENLYGQLTVNGQRKAGVTTNWGAARFDYLMCKGVQLTRMVAPWHMNRDRFVFGAEAPSANSSQGLHRLTAEVFGGVVEADGVVSLRDERYEFQLNNLVVKDFEAARVARELKMPSRISGLGEARLAQLRGSAEGMHTLRGSGAVRLRDADLAKLPQIIQLVNEMRLRNVRSDAFTSSDIDFRIDGPHLYFGRFDLHGESLSLKGRGEIGFDRRIDLTFHTILGGENRWLPFVRPFVGQASEQLLQIPVSGTLDDMKWDRRVLPGLNDWFPEQAR